MASSPLSVESLTPSERLELLDRLWESLTETPAAIPVTDAQKAELARRLAAYNRDADNGISFEDVERRILGAAKP